MVAYSQSALPTKAFQEKYDAILASFSPSEINAQLIHYGANNFNVYFPRDTFNFAHMEQFELRDGFWFYEYGKEPLDMGAEENGTAIINKANDYFNEDY
jgi:hypothetical protein